jgi:TRAP-type C4-dicarboxylate transport system substrate-binding protein
MKRVLRSIIIMTLLAGVVFVAPAAGAPKAVKLKAVLFVPTNNPMVATSLWYRDRVNKASEGNLTIDIVGGPEAIHAMDQPNAIATGVVDMLIGCPAAYFEPMMPEALALGINGLTSWEERETGFYDLFDTIFQKKANSKYIGKTYSSEPFEFFTNSPLNKPEDLSGLRIRTMPLYEPLVKAYGGSPSSMPLTDVYTAMERGVVDGYMIVCPVALGFKLYEVTKYGLKTGVYASEPVTLINLDKWNKLSKSQQDLLLDVHKKMEPEATEYMLDLDGKAWKKFEASGMKITEFTPSDAESFRKTASKVGWDYVTKRCPEYGPQLKKLSKQF